MTVYVWAQKRYRRLLELWQIFHSEYKYHLINCQTSGNWTIYIKIFLAHIGSFCLPVSLSVSVPTSFSPLCLWFSLYSAVWCISLSFIVYESWNVGEEHLRDFLDLTSHGMVSNGLHLNMLFVVCTHFLHQYSLSSCMCLHSYK